MLEAKKMLEGMGHEVNVPIDTKSHIENTKLIDDLESNYKYVQ